MGILDRFKKKEESCREQLLGQIKEAHYNRQIIEGLSKGEIEPPEDFTDDSLQGMWSQNIHHFDNLSAAFAGCDDMNPEERLYWALHTRAFYGYILARAHMAEEAAEAFLYVMNGFITLENELPYPQVVPWDEINEYSDGVFFFALKAHGHYAACLSQQDKTEEAAEAYRDTIKEARTKYSEHSDLLFEMLRKAGEFFRIEAPEEALGYFKEALEILGEDADLESSIKAEDLTLLYMKDMYATQLGIVGRSDEEDEARKELEPYKDLMTWRVETNIFDMMNSENEED